MDRAQFDSLDETDANLICDLLAAELVASGLGPDSEPNERGLELEAAIDWIRSKVACSDS